MTAVEHAGKAGELLQDIAESVSTIADMNSQIAVASEEQSTVTQDINRSIVNIQNISEQTSVGAMQTSKSSQQLLILGNHFRQLVEQFQV
jgi:methyl-accepting chemotaxis protein